MIALLPGDVRAVIQKHSTIKSFTPARGGCINNGGRLETSAGVLFLKWNDAALFPGMFEAEAKGLALLVANSALRVPRVHEHNVAEAHQFILMEFIEMKATTPGYWEHLGSGLAELHRVTSSHFGLDHDNYIGSLPQRNQLHSSWTEFFIQQRLEPQLQLLGATALHHKFDKLKLRLESLFPKEAPSMLHGDLWSGNLIRDESGLPCLIDPAVYFGHREMEIAFTKLFGGFDSRFYDTYKEVFPLEAGHEERVDLCNLYPLLVHANLFGGHYVVEIEDILRRWT